MGVLRKTSGIVLAICVGIALTSCSGGEANYPYKQGDETVWGESYGDVQAKRETMFGQGGINLFGEDKAKADGAGGSAGLGVNSFLWRATLDTIVFMPVSSADPFGGVIITDWHSPAATPNERFKLNLYILGRALRADGVRVALFRQVQTRAGHWQDAAVPKTASTEIENAILTRARQLRNETLQE